MSRVIFKLGELLILTIIFEASFAFILGVRSKKDFINIILVNIATNPLINTIMIPVDLRCSYYLRKGILIFLEIMVVLVEGLIYKKYLEYRKINPFILSLLLNLFSYGVGIMIFGF